MAADLDALNESQAEMLRWMEQHPARPPQLQHLEKT